MKNTLLFLMLLLSWMAGAQIVNIPDPLFKDDLLNNTFALDSGGNYIDLDANEDGEIEVSEALLVWSLDMSNTNASSLEGLEAFSNLRSFSCGDLGSVVSLNLTILPNLEYVYIHHSDLQHLNVEGLVNLEYLTCYYGDLAALDCSSLTNLKELDLTMQTSLVELNVAGLSNLEKIIVPYGAFTSLDLYGLDNLEVLDLSDCQFITSLDLSEAPNLKMLGIGAATNLADLNIASCTNLENLDINASSLSVLDLTAMEVLQKLQVSYYSEMSVPYSLILGQKPFLTNADIDISATQDLDMSGCTALTRLRLDVYGSENAPSNSFVNLKNGITGYEAGSYFYVGGPVGSYVHVCLDEGEHEAFSSILSPSSAQNVIVSTYCSFAPGGAHNTITGNFTFDSAGDGCSTTDTFAGFMKVAINDGITTGTSMSTTGHYNFYTGTGTFILTPELENDWFTISPPSATITFDAIDNSTVTQNFCITANGVHPDVEVVVVPFWEAQPGFDAYYKIVYKNKGNQMLSGTVTLNYDDNVLDHVESTPVESAFGTGTLTWDYTGLVPFESRSIDVRLNLNGPMEIPAVNLNDVLAFSASITPSTGDETPADNTFSVNQVVTGSYDPNDISCLEGDTVSPEKIGGYLHYNINFENTGTAPATFIAVKNNIDETKFDISSLQMLYSSHPVEVRVTENKLEFYFGNINLGPEEKGNVIYKIKTLNTLVVNDEVMQQADIFFDYNWPVQTNEAVTTFQVLSQGDFEPDNSVMVYPNPAKNAITISADTELKSVQLYDIQGRLLQSAIISGTSTGIDLSSRASGMYFVKITTEKGTKIEKVVKE